MAQPSANTSTNKGSAREVPLVPNLANHSLEQLSNQPNTDFATLHSQNSFDHAPGGQELQRLPGTPDYSPSSRPATPVAGTDSIAVESSASADSPASGPETSEGPSGLPTFVLTRPPDEDDESQPVRLANVAQGPLLSFSINECLTEMLKTPHVEKWPSYPQRVMQAIEAYHHADDNTGLAAQAVSRYVQRLLRKYLQKNGKRADGPTHHRGDFKCKVVTVAGTDDERTFNLEYKHVVGSHAVALALHLYDWAVDPSGDRIFETTFPFLEADGTVSDHNGKRDRHRGLIERALEQEVPIRVEMSVFPVGNNRKTAD